MPATDDPLKNLVYDFAPDFAAWFLNVDRATVRRVQPLNVELPARKKWSDTLFRVSLAWPLPTAEPTDILLHVEFQSKDSARPMPWRMVDYLARIAERELDYRHLAHLPLCSAVLYVGDGAGAHDTGDYRLGCPDGGVTLAWRYRVIRLWQMPAEELLALGRPSLMALIGQTQIAAPTQVIPQAVAAIGQLPDPETRSRLFGALIGLMRDEEVLAMTERLMKAIERDPLLNTPFLRRIREEGRAEEREKFTRERERFAQVMVAMRQDVLDVLATRFNPPVMDYRSVESQLSIVTDMNRLRQLLQVAFRATDITEFEAALAG